MQQCHHKKICEERKNLFFMLAGSHRRVKTFHQLYRDVLLDLRYIVFLLVMLLQIKRKERFVLYREISLMKEKLRIALYIYKYFILSEKVHILYMYRYRQKRLKYRKIIFILDWNVI